MTTIFITGASSGLGKAAATLFAKKGWKVLATMRNPTKEQELSTTKNISLIALDVTNASQITNVVEDVTKTNNIDVVFNNAGYALTGALESFSEDKIIKQLNTNLLGAILVTRAFVPYFRSKGQGLFITTTSIGGLVAYPLNSVYHATKWGLEGFSESLSFELNPFNIRVKTIEPGSMKSDFMSKADFVRNEAYDNLLSKTVAMFSRSLGGSAPEVIAEAVYEAATDGKDQLRYVAGEDAISAYARRLKVGDEAFMKEIQSMIDSQS
jgi:NAD(P)-dependent dehydrogenase (short-subunit alcohol dehydrogenase family)